MLVYLQLMDPWLSFSSHFPKPLDLLRRLRQSDAINSGSLKSCGSSAPSRPSHTNAQYLQGWKKRANRDNPNCLPLQLLAHLGRTVFLELGNLEKDHLDPGAAIVGLFSLLLLNELGENSETFRKAHSKSLFSTDGNAFLRQILKNSPLRRRDLQGPRPLLLQLAVAIMGQVDGNPENESQETATIKKLSVLDAEVRLRAELTAAGVHGERTIFSVAAEQGKQGGTKLSHGGLRPPYRDYTMKTEIPEKWVGNDGFHGDFFLHLTNFFTDPRQLAILLRGKKRDDLHEKEKKEDAPQALEKRYLRPLEEACVDLAVGIGVSEPNNPLVLLPFLTAWRWNRSGKAAASEAAEGEEDKVDPTKSQWICISLYLRHLLRTARDESSPDFLASMKQLRWQFRNELQGDPSGQRQSGQHSFVFRPEDEQPEVAENGSSDSSSDSGQEDEEPEKEEESVPKAKPKGPPPPPTLFEMCNKEALVGWDPAFTIASRFYYWLKDDTTTGEHRFGTSPWVEKSDPFIIWAGLPPPTKKLHPLRADDPIDGVWPREDHVSQRETHTEDYAYAEKKLSKYYWGADTDESYSSYPYPQHAAADKINGEFAQHCLVFWARSLVEEAVRRGSNLAEVERRLVMPPPAPQEEPSSSVGAAARSAINSPIMTTSDFFSRLATFADEEPRDCPLFEGDSRLTRKTDKAVFSEVQQRRGWLNKTSALFVCKHDEKEKLDAPVVFRTTPQPLRRLANPKLFAETMIARLRREAKLVRSYDATTNKKLRRCESELQEGPKTKRVGLVSVKKLVSPKEVVGVTNRPRPFCARNAAVVLKLQNLFNSHAAPQEKQQKIKALLLEEVSRAHAGAETLWRDFIETRSVSSVQLQTTSTPNIPEADRLLTHTRSVRASLGWQPHLETPPGLQNAGVSSALLRAAAGGESSALEFFQCHFQRQLAERSLKFLENNEEGPQRVVREYEGWLRTNFSRGRGGRGLAEDCPTQHRGLLPSAGDEQQFQLSPLIQAYPELRVFEVFADLSFRPGMSDRSPGQADVVRAFFPRDLANSHVPDRFMELTMGGGKTAVLLPLISTLHLLTQRQDESRPPSPQGGDPPREGEDAAGVVAIGQEQLSGGNNVGDYWRWMIADVDEQAVKYTPLAGKDYIPVYETPHSKNVVEYLRQGDVVEADGEPQNITVELDEVEEETGEKKSTSYTMLSLKSGGAVDLKDFQKTKVPCFSSAFCPHQKGILCAFTEMNECRR